MTDPIDLTTWTDEEVREEWLGSSWEPGEPMADALAVEMHRRNLDF